MSNDNDKTMITQDIVTTLMQTALIEDLPEQRFLDKMTARRRRETRYHVAAQAPGLALRLEITGAGVMTACVTMETTLIDEGAIKHPCESHVLSWADSGEQAIISTRLGNRHLTDKHNAADVIRAFLEAIGTKKNAICPGGYRQWQRGMALMASKIARDTGRHIEIIASPPLPHELHQGMRRTDRTQIEINDITTADTPIALSGYDDDFLRIDDEMSPEAVTLMLLAPGLLVRKKHREIFHAK